MAESVTVLFTVRLRTGMALVRDESACGAYMRHQGQESILPSPIYSGTEFTFGA